MLGKDLLHAIRGLRKSPGFAVISIATIALGIGASTAIFSVVNAVLLQPLPYRDAGRLALIESDMRRRNVVDFPFSGPDFDDMRHGNTQFEEIAGVFTDRAVVHDDTGEPAVLSTAAVTPNFIRLLGGRVTLGRDFTDNDATPQAPAAAGAAPAAQPALPTMAILSNDLWKRRYGGDPNALGRSIELDGGGKAQIVGVLEPGFELLFPPRAGVERRPELWTALRADFATAGRNDVFLHLIGRLKPGASVETAQAEEDRLAVDLRKRFVIRETSGFLIRVEPMRQHLVAAARPAILAIMGAVMFLLLIACANVANLLLVRAASRGRELAVRAAMGGSRWDLVRQMLAESLLLAGSGALLGLLLAAKGIDLLIYLAPANLPRLDSVAIDPMVLGFTALVAGLSAVVFGVLPALRASRPDIMDVLRASGRTTGLGRGRMLRNGVVMAEVALSFVLLVGSGLMVRSFLAIVRTDPGFRADGVLTFLMPIVRATPEERHAAENDFQNRLRTLPGVTLASAVNSLPLDGQNPVSRWGTEEALADPGRFRAANLFTVLPGYFDAMGTRLLAGRTFTDGDNQPGLHLVMIDELLASKAFPHASAIGKRLLCRISTPEPEWFQVIGVVEHQRHDTLVADGHEGIYVMDGSLGFGAASRWVLRTQGDPMKLSPLVREEIAKLDKRLAVADMQPMTALVTRAQAETRFALILIAVFAGIAALFAAVGLYGVLASAVKQRTAEIGVRVALGAAPASIFGLVVGQGLALSAVGIAIGMVAALGLTGAMTTMLVGVKPTDPLTFVAMAGLFLAVSAIASGIPARRAAGLDPTNALREE
jgi:putative ABC transport system permease protein